MVASREARRAARRAAIGSEGRRLGDTPADTAGPAQAVQDALLRRTPPAEKLLMVARLSRMVEALSLQGLKSRHPNADHEQIRYLRAVLRLGTDLADSVYRRRDSA